MYPIGQANLVIVLTCIIFIFCFTTRYCGRRFAELYKWQKFSTIVYKFFILINRQESTICYDLLVSKHNLQSHLMGNILYSIGDSCRNIGIHRWLGILLGLSKLTEMICIPLIMCVDWLTLSCPCIMLTGFQMQLCPTQGNHSEYQHS
jgi:hypothetical protein